MPGLNTLVDTSNQPRGCPARSAPSPTPRARAAQAESGSPPHCYSAPDAVSGADYFLDLLDFEAHLDGCDLVITGEGRIDDQTLHGKLPADRRPARRTGPGRSPSSGAATSATTPGSAWACAPCTRSPTAPTATRRTTPACPRACSSELGRTMPLPRH